VRFELNSYISFRTNSVLTVCSGGSQSGQRVKYGHESCGTLNQKSHGKDQMQFISRSSFVKS
jgi:hypothetical protein